MDQSKRYLTRLRRALVCPKKDRERLLRDAGTMLESFAQENPDAFYQDYVASFGQPEDFAAEMLSSLDPEDIADARQRRKRIFLTTAGAIGALLILLAGFWIGRRSQPLPPESPPPSASAASQPSPELTSTPAPEASEPAGPMEGDAASYVEQTFSDSSEIKYKEAVGYIARLGIMGGTDDGRFVPDEHITRAQAARIVALLMRGGNDTDLDVKEEASFSDITGHWAEAYIEFCFDVGVIDGQEDGSFGPEEEITVLELVRMAIRMLGYDADAYRLRGENWAIQVDQLARTMDPMPYAGLVDENLSSPVTKEAAAQIFFNALCSTPKRVVPYQNPADRTVTWQYVNATREDGSPETLLRERFNLELEEIVFD